VSSELTLDQLHRALQVNDPQLVNLIVQLSHQIDIPRTPLRQGADTFDNFLLEATSTTFRKKSADEQWALRVERIAALEAADAEVPLTHCLRLHEILFALYERNDAFGRWCLLQVIPGIALTYGPWRALKSIFKQAEAKQDTEMFGTLAARFDQALASKDYRVSRNTLVYLVGRAWRYLRRMGEGLPACYADVACDVLANYDDNTDWNRTWIANHVFYHETGSYNRNQFTYRSRPSTLLKFRAFADSWRLTPRPLFSLLERAKSEQVRRFATSALKTDFRASLRDVEPQWISRLVGASSAIIDDFVIWVLANVPRFEQSSYRELGLHDAVLSLFHSPSDAARVYAASYARTHARDLPVNALVRLIDNAHGDVRTLAIDLLKARDPRKDIGLEAWGDILEARYGTSFATDVLLKHFSKRELTPEWYQQRLLFPASRGFDFAVEHLIPQHGKKALGADYFSDLLAQMDYRQESAYRTVAFACEGLQVFDLNGLDTNLLKEYLIHPDINGHVVEWVDQGMLNPQSFSLEFLKVVVFHPTWQADAWIEEKQRSADWTQTLEYSPELAVTVFDWLADIRYFTPDQLTFDWLMLLVERSEPNYHQFAVAVMNKAFLPADFAPASGEGEPEAEVSANVEINVDFGGDSFLFTGKLSKMTRAEAKGKVTAAGGSNASGVTKNLKWLVIGDEGSSLYGEGRKGSKQVKAESLIEDGAELRIISETAFLQRLSGEQREFSDDAIAEGCIRLWEMITDTDKEDAPLTLFALSYIRNHHPDICLAETDRPVDPGAEIPADFLDFERLFPLFNDSRITIRAFALEMARWEFSRWQPPMTSIVTLCESSYPEVRGFVAKALTVEDAPEHKRYRIDQSVLTADAVYRFCESLDRSARELGMALIEQHPRLQLPQELFRLTESSDREIRGFVIRRFWHWYRDRGVTSTWKPWQPSQAGDVLDGGASKKPDMLPASGEHLEQFLRRVLFEIAPGRLPMQVKQVTNASKRLKPLPTRQAKLELIETLRDIAMEDIEFARYVLPLLNEFKGSRGKSEHAACLVAVTRIEVQHPSLNLRALF